MELKEEEVAQLKTLQQRQSVLLTELGNISLIKIQLDQRETVAKDYFKTTAELEKNIANDIQKEYGEGSVDIAKGIFIPAEKSDK